MARLQRRHHAGRISRPDQRFVLLVGDVDPVKPVLDVPVAADPGRQGGWVGDAVAGDEVDDFDGLLAVLRDRAAQLRDLGRAVPFGAPGYPAQKDMAGQAVNCEPADRRRSGRPGGRGNRATAGASAPSAVAGVAARPRPGRQLPARASLLH